MVRDGARRAQPRRGSLCGRRSVPRGRAAGAVRAHAGRRGRARLLAIRPPPPRFAPHAAARRRAGGVAAAAELEPPLSAAWTPTRALPSMDRLMACLPPDFYIDPPGSFGSSALSPAAERPLFFSFICFSRAPTLRQRLNDPEARRPFSDVLTWRVGHLKFPHAESWTEEYRQDSIANRLKNPGSGT
jgi:hypothetical protein